MTDPTTDTIFPQPGGVKAIEWACRGLAVLAAIAAAAWLYVAVHQLSFPGDLTGWEGAMVDHVRRVTQGQPLYAQPSLDFTPLLYGPLYYWLCAAFAGLGDLAFALPRGISLIASLGSGVLLAALIRQCSGGWLAGAIAAGIFYAAAPWADNWYALAHVDALQLALMLLALLLWTGRPGRARLIGCGMALAAALLTKQSAAPVAVLIGLDGLLFRRRDLAWLAVGGLAVAGPAMGWLAYDDGHWAWRFLIDLPQKFGLQWGSLARPAVELKRLAPSAIVGAVAVALLVLRGVAWRRLLLPVVALIVVGWLGRIHPGSGLNALMPAIAGLALLGGLGAAWAMRVNIAVLRWACVVAIAAQFGVLLRDPRPTVPPPESTQEFYRVRQAVLNLPANALILGNGFLVGRIAGSEPLALRDYFATLSAAARDTEMARLREELAQRGYPPIVVTQLGAEILDWLTQDNYRPAVPLLPRTGDFLEKGDSLVVLQRR